MIKLKQERSNGFSNYWQVGEWARVASKSNFIGVITSITPGEKKEVELDNQDGKVKKFAKLSNLIMPSPSEIGAHLSSIAARRYPIGTKVIDAADDNYIETVLSHNFKYYPMQNLLVAGSICIWRDCWAEKCEPKLFESWKVEIEDGFIKVSPQGLLSNTNQLVEAAGIIQYTLLKAEKNEHRREQTTKGGRGLSSSTRRMHR